MELMPTQMAYQRWLLPDMPAAFPFFHEAKMLRVGGQRSGEALLQPAADLGRVDFAKSGRKVDARAPGVEWTQRGETGQLLAVALRGHAREPPAVSLRHDRDPSGCDKTGGETL